MRVSKVKERFKKDFEANFYEFDGRKIRKNIMQQIAFQNIQYGNHKLTNSKKPLNLIFFSRVLAVLVIVLALVMINQYFGDKYNGVEVDSLFKAAQVEYTQEPILVSSTYSGEELRIYQGITKVNGIETIQYFYFYNEISLSKVHHLTFVNRDENINVEISTKNNFGNLSQLLNINPNNNIEVILVYENNEIFSQFFIATENTFKMATN